MVYGKNQIKKWGRDYCGALGDEAGGYEVREVTGAVDFGLEEAMVGDAINTFF